MYLCRDRESYRRRDDAHDAAAAKRRCDVFWKHARRILKTSRKFHAEASRLTLNNFLNDDDITKHGSLRSSSHLAFTSHAIEELLLLPYDTFTQITNTPCFDFRERFV